MTLKIIFVLMLTCFLYAGCSQKQQNEEIKEKVIFVKIPPVRDAKLSNQERYWQFQKFLFPQIQIPNPVPKGLPNDDSLLFIKLEENKSVKINAHTICNLVEINKLQARLIEVFQNRTEHGVFEPSSDKIVKAVLIIAPDSVKYGEVFELIEAVEKSGADPIVLKIGESPDTVIMSVE
ncbi:hypothetical protein BH10ACI1_BH10ACI1_11320 [soil metagenome]